MVALKVYTAYLSSGAFTDPEFYAMHMEYWSDGVLNEKIRLPKPLSTTQTHYCTIPSFHYSRSNDLLSFLFESLKIIRGNI
jgi:hypothetical protein